MLTPRQEKFCIEYLKCGNLRTAYINAGYKKCNTRSADANACRLLKKDNIQARLQELTEQSKNSAIADITEMQEVLTRIIRQGMTEEVPMAEGKGDGISEIVTIDKKPAIKDVIQAINTLGKMQGCFKEKVEVEAIIPVFAGEDELLE